MCVYLLIISYYLFPLSRNTFFVIFFTRIHTSKNMFENWSASLKIIFYSSFPLFVVRSHTIGSG